MQEYFQGFSVFEGVVRRKDLQYLLATKNELVEKNTPHTMVYELYQGRWGGDPLAWSACSASVCHFPKERFIIISPNGLVQVIGGGQDIEEQPIVSSQQLEPKLILREVRGIAKGRAYAVGPARTVYRRDAPNKWTCIDAPTPASDDLMDAGFESIDGFSETDIYAVGWGGDIWHYDGQQWKPIDSPTSLGLFKVRCAEDGYVYACGQVGMLLRGHGEQWEIIEHDVTEANLRGMEWFKGKLYISSTDSVYELVENQLHKVDFGDDFPMTCYHLSAADGIMWSIGAKDVMEFDGQTWTRILQI